MSITSISYKLFLIGIDTSTSKISRRKKKRKILNNCENYKKKKCTKPSIMTPNKLAEWMDE